MSPVADKKLLPRAKVKLEPKKVRGNSPSRTSESPSLGGVVRRQDKLEAEQQDANIKAEKSHLLLTEAMQRLSQLERVVSELTVEENREKRFGMLRKPRLFSERAQERYAAACS